MSPAITQDTLSSWLSLLLRLVTFVVVIWVMLNVGQVTAWSGQGCCELTQDARCRRVCLRVCLFVCLSVSVLLVHRVRY